MCTCVTTKMDFKATGFVIALVTAWVCTGELACLSQVSSVVGKQGTEGDEGLFTSWGTEHTNRHASYFNAETGPDGTE